MTCQTPSNENGLILPTDVNSQICLTSCQQGECLTSNFKCSIPNKSIFLLPDETDSFKTTKCITTCPDNYCLTKEFTCIKTTDTKVRSLTGERCVDFSLPDFNSKDYIVEDPLSKLTAEQINFTLQATVNKIVKTDSESKTIKESIEELKVINLASTKEKSTDNIKAIVEANSKNIVELIGASYQSSVNSFYGISTINNNYGSETLLNKDIITEDKERIILNSICLPLVNNKDNFSSPNCNQNGICNSLENDTFSCVCRIGFCGYDCSLLCSEMTASLNIFNSFFTKLSENKRLLQSLTTVETSATSASSVQEATDSVTTTTTTESKSTFEDTFTQQKLDEFVISVKAASLIYDNLDQVKNNILPIISLINLNLSKDKISKLLVANYNKMFTTIETVYSLFNRLITKTKTQNLFEYLISLDKSKVLQEPINIRFYIKNSLSGDYVEFINNTNMSNIYDLLHQTNSYNGIKTNNGQTVKSTDAFIPQITSIFSLTHPEFKISNGYKENYGNFINYAQNIIFSTVSNLITSTSKDDTLSYKMSNIYFKVYLQDISSNINGQTVSLTSQYDQFLVSNNLTEDKYNCYFDGFNQVKSMELNNTKITISFVVFEGYSRDYNSYNNNSHTDAFTGIVDLKFYSVDRKIAAISDPVKIFLTLNPAFSGVNSYLELNKDKFYSRDEWFNERMSVFEDTITQPYLIDYDGHVDRKYTQILRINDLHKFINIVPEHKNGNDNMNNIRYINNYIVINTTHTEQAFASYNFEAPSYKNQTNSYWWDRTEIFSVTENYKNGTFILYIIMFIIYMIVIPILLVSFCWSKDFNGEQQINLNTQTQPQAQVETVNKPIVDKEKEINREDDEKNEEPVRVGQVHEEKGYSKYEVNYKNLSFCEAFTLNMKNGLYSGLMRTQTIHSPKYKEIVHQWFFKYFALFIFTLLFNFSEMNTFIPIADNAKYLCWFTAIVLVTSNVLNCLIYFVYSASEKDKNLDFDNNEDGISNLKFKSLIKSIILLCFTLALFGFMWYGINGYCAVYENYDHVFLVTFVLQNVVDFIIFEFIVSILVGLLASTDKEASGCVLNALTTFTKWRCGA